MLTAVYFGKNKYFKRGQKWSCRTVKFSYNRLMSFDKWFRLSCKHLPFLT